MGSLLQDFPNVTWPQLTSLKLLKNPMTKLQLSSIQNALKTTSPENLALAWSRNDIDFARTQVKPQTPSCQFSSSSPNCEIAIIVKDARGNNLGYGG